MDPEFVLMQELIEAHLCHAIYAGAARTDKLDDWDRDGLIYGCFAENWIITQRESELQQLRG